jgi:hypothetical protein
VAGRREIERIVCIEIIEGQLNALKTLAARRRFDGLRTLLNDPRVSHVYADGRIYVLRSGTSYDIIEADAVQPYARDLPAASRTYTTSYSNHPLSSPNRPTASSAPAKRSNALERDRRSANSWWARFPCVEPFEWVSFSAQTWTYCPPDSCRRRVGARPETEGREPATKTPRYRARPKCNHVCYRGRASAR